VSFGAGADWGQKASSAKGFIKATETLQKMPHIGKASISLKKSSKIIEFSVKAPHF
jgi:hypothetical protein